MGKQKKKTRFKTRIAHSSSKSRRVDIRPDDLATYVRRAEPQAIPIIKELEVSAGAAILLLAQYTQALISGNPKITLESATAITDSVLAIWQTGTYHPSAQYPFTLEETLLDLKNDMKAQNDYSKCFQSLTPMQPLPPRGVGQIAGGIVLHPKTYRWQIWMMFNGSCEFLGAYHDASTAQNMLEEIINITRQGKGPGFAEALYKKITSKGDGEPQQIPFDMMSYLIDHLDSFLIDL